MTASAAPALSGLSGGRRGEVRPRVPSRGFARLTVAAAVVTYLLIVAGGIVRVSGSGLGCGSTGDDWPLCHGRLVPPADTATVIEFTHRCFATLSTILVAFVVVLAWVRYREQRRLLVACTVAAAFFVVQVLLGAATVELKLPGPVVMVHLANAEFLLATLVVIATTTRALRREPQAAAAVPLWVLAAAAAGAYLLVLSGAFVVANGAGFACSAWPLCGGGFSLDSGQLAVMNVAHRFVAGAVAIVVTYAMVRVLRAGGARRARPAAVLALVLLAAQVVAGAVMVETRLQPWTRGLHEALASALWAMVVLVVVLAQRQPLLAAETAAAAAPDAVPA